MFECNKLYTPSPITRFRARSTFSGLWTRLLLACLPWACTQWFHYISGSSNRFIDDWDQCKSVMYCCTVCSAYKVCQSNPPKCQLNKRQTVVGCLVFSVSTWICSCVFRTFPLGSFDWISLHLISSLWIYSALLYTPVIYVGRLICEL